MGYWIAVPVSTTRSGVICNNKLRLGDVTIRSILIIPCEICLNIQLITIRRIGLLGRSRCRVDGHQYVLWLLWRCPCSCPRNTPFPESLYLTGKWIFSNHFGPWWTGFHIVIPYSVSYSWCSWCCLLFVMTWCFLPFLRRFWNVVKIFLSVVDLLAFAGAVFLAPPIIFPIVGLVLHNLYWIFQNPGWEIPDMDWLYIFCFPVGFLVCQLLVIHEIMGHSNYAKDMWILGVLGVSPPWREEVVVFSWATSLALFTENTYIPPTHSHWFSWSPWRVDMMRCSRDYIFVSKYTSRFPLQ